jgi:hypothetical protein
MDGEGSVLGREPTPERTVEELGRARFVGEQGVREMGREGWI